MGQKSRLNCLKVGYIQVAHSDCGWNIPQVIEQILIGSWAGPDISSFLPVFSQLLTE